MKKKKLKKKLKRLERKCTQWKWCYNRFVMRVTKDVSDIKESIGQIEKGENNGN